MQIAVLIPARMADFDEPHPRFAKPTGHQTLASETAGWPRPHAIGIEHVLRLLGKVKQFRYFALHFESQLVRLNYAVKLIRRSGGRCQVAIHGLHKIDLLALQRLDGLGL